MNKEALAVVILAAGHGTRMKSDLPKVLHPLAGRPILSHVLGNVAPLGPERVVVVVGKDMAAVEAAAAPHATVLQDPPLGTGHAVLQAMAALPGYHGAAGGGEVLVIFGDTPLLSPESLSCLLEAKRDSRGPMPASSGHSTADPRRARGQRPHQRSVARFADPIGGAW